MEKTDNAAFHVLSDEGSVTIASLLAAALNRALIFSTARAVQAYPSTCSILLFLLKLMTHMRRPTS